MKKEGTREYCAADIYVSILNSIKLFMKPGITPICLLLGLSLRMVNLVYLRLA